MIMVLMDRYCLPEECFSNRLLPGLARSVAILPVFFILYGVLKLLDGKQLTANDPFSSGEYMLKPCPFNGRRQELNQTLMEEMRMLFLCVKLDHNMSTFQLL